jgi:hypothetical protein
MAIRAPKLEGVAHDKPRQKQASFCARDRLLTALKSSPRLSRKDTDMINRVVREAREASVADELLA